MSHVSTIKLFLPFGDPKRVRTAEISNWSGKAVAGPRSELDKLLARDELERPGVYVLVGQDVVSGDAAIYVGEAEVVSERLKQHKSKEFWNSAIVFVSKDENLTKSHIKYLEGRLIDSAIKVGRYKVMNEKSSGAHLPESDRHDMEVFLDRASQLLPVLGTDMLTPVTPVDQTNNEVMVVFHTSSKDAKAQGIRSPNGFVVMQGATAALYERPAAQKHGAWVITLRDKLKADGSLVEKDNLLVFTRDVEFASPSAAAAVIHGGPAQGTTVWKNAAGKTLKEVEEGA